jgi:hypothetical protein
MVSRPSLKPRGTGNGKVAPMPDISARALEGGSSVKVEV